MYPWIKPDQIYYKNIFLFHLKMIKNAFLIISIGGIPIRKPQIREQMSGTEIPIRKPRCKYLRWGGLRILPAKCL